MVRLKHQHSRKRLTAHFVQLFTVYAILFIYLYFFFSYLILKIFLKAFCSAFYLNANFTVHSCAFRLCSSSGALTVRCRCLNRLAEWIAAKLPALVCNADWLFVQVYNVKRICLCVCVRHIVAGVLAGALVAADCPSIFMNEWNNNVVSLANYEICVCFAREGTFFVFALQIVITHFFSLILLYGIRALFCLCVCVCGRVWFFPVVWCIKGCTKCLCEYLCVKLFCEILKLSRLGFVKNGWRNIFNWVMVPIKIKSW